MTPMPKYRPKGPGADYPAMPRLNKFRAVASRAGGVMKLDKSYRREYGAAVEKEIRSLQRAAMAKTYTMPAPRCASGSWANTPEAIEKAVRARQARDNAAACRRDREGRSDAVVLALYEEAMALKPAPSPRARS